MGELSLAGDVTLNLFAALSSASSLTVRASTGGAPSAAIAGKRRDLDHTAAQG